MSDIKVSVVVPVYNVEPYIHQCLDSLINQTLKSIEIIVVDDGSPDNCPSIIDEYAARDKRITAIHKKNGGVSAARNDGLKIATGDYVFVCDSDDWMELDALEKLYKAGNKSNADAVISDHYVCNGKGKHRIKSFDAGYFDTDDRNAIDIIQSACLTYGSFKTKNRLFRIAHNVGAPWCHLYRLSLIKENQLCYDSSLKGISDDIMFNLMFYQCAEKVSYVSEVTYNYRLVDGSLTKSYKPGLPTTYHNVFKSMEAYIASINKRNLFAVPYALRCIVYLDRMMDYYFINPKNDKSKVQLKKEYTELFSSPPYNACFRNLDMDCILSKKLKAKAFILKHGLLGLYWMLSTSGII